MFSVVTIITRSSHRRRSANKGVLKNFANSQENTYVWVSFLIKLQAWIPFLQYTSGRLLLYTLSFNKYKHSPNKYKIYLKIIVIFRFATETCSSKICLWSSHKNLFEITWGHLEFFSCAFNTTCCSASARKMLQVAIEFSQYSSQQTLQSKSD